MSGAFVQLTKTGYYKSSWAVVNGKELYIYQNKDSIKHTNLYILQGARISCDTSTEG